MHPMLASVINSLKFRFQATEFKGIMSGGDIFGIEENPKIDYATLVDIYEKDGTAGFVVDGTVKAAVGIGYHYRHDGSPEGEEQVKILEDFNNSKYVLMKGRNIEIGSAMYGYGFCPVEPNDPNFMTEITTLPMRARWSWKRKTYGGKFEYIRQRFNGLDAKFDVDAGELIPFTMNVNADNPLGRGILHRLAETAPYKLQFSDGTTKSMHRFSLYRAKQMLLHDISKLIHHGVPISLVQVRVPNSEINNAADKIEKADPGQRFVTNASQVEIKSEMTDIRNGFRQLIDVFNNDYITALQSFLPKFFGDSAWTEASATVAEKIWYNALVLSLQDSFAEIKIRLIDDVILRQHGFDENHTKYYWGMPKGSEIQPAIVVQVMAQIVSFFQAGLLQPDYAVKLFNQLLDTLGNMGIALDTKAAGAADMGAAATKMANALLDGNFTADNRKMAEQWLNHVKNGKLVEQVVPRKIR